MNRRLFVEGLLATAVAAVSGLYGSIARAARPEPAFAAKSVPDALRAALGVETVTMSDAISIKAPDLAENGAMVPVEVSMTLPNVTSLSFLVEGNQMPLAATFELTPNVRHMLATRIRMGKSSDVIVVARAGDAYYAARKHIKVTIGGCGG
jgi:sulfur-oxidizing protein SoxY